MDELSDFFNSLYSHFLLRDIVAKVIPGLIGLAAVLSMLAPFGVLDMQRFAHISSFVQMILLYGLGFMFGMLIQYLVTKLPCVHVHVHDGKDNKARIEASLKKDVEFHKCAGNQQFLSRKRERLVIIKEMGANYAGALIIVLIVFLLHSCRLSLSWATWIPIIIVLLSMIIVLFLQNRFYANEQRLWEDIVIENEK